MGFSIRIDRDYVLSLLEGILTGNVADTRSFGE
jgi:hypothetical protein